jgi:uncharacterized Fe-S cluster-containing radical SAM superfamily protein
MSRTNFDTCGTNVFITNKCNLNCSFCYIEKSEDVLDILAFRENLQRYKSLLKSSLFNLTGGEPLLYFPVCKEAVSVIKEQCPDARLKLYTNGLLLTGEIVNFINENNIATLIGCHQPENLDFSLVKKIKRKAFKIIINEPKDVIEKAYFLYKTFFDCKIGVAINHKILSKISLKEIFAVIDEVRKLIDVFFIDGFGIYDCDCDAVSFTNNGIVNKQEGFIEQFNKKACVGIVKWFEKDDAGDAIDLYKEISNQLVMLKDARDLLKYIYQLIQVRSCEKPIIHDDNVSYLFTKILGVL